MQKMKQGMAVVLTATMVLGSSFAALAAPVAAGSTSGAGTSEGHVDKEVVNMVLPTVATGTSPFAYTMDPERLIQETNGAKYEDFTFPASDSDTGVYFLTGEKEYANTSNTLQAINKSSCDVTLTVKVKATASTGGKDITLATSETPSTSAAELYLGLKVGSETKIVKAAEQTVTKTIEGTAGNFATVVKDKEGSTNGEKVYAYEEKADATTWKAMNISMTGAVSNKAIAADTTAPTVDVTWEYEKAADGETTATDAVDYTNVPATSSAAAIVVPDEGNATAVVTIGSDEAAPSSLTTDWFTGDMFELTDGWGATYNAESKTITFDADISDALRTDKTHVFTVTFTPADGEGYTQSLTYAE